MHTSQETPVGNQRGESRKAGRILPGTPRLPVVCMYRHRLGGYIAVGLVAWAGPTPEPHAGSIGGDTAIERMSEVLTWLTLVLVWFGM